MSLTQILRCIDHIYSSALNCIYQLMFNQEVENLELSMTAHLWICLCGLFCLLFFCWLLLLFGFGWVFVCLVWFFFFFLSLYKCITLNSNWYSKEKSEFLNNTLVLGNSISLLQLVIWNFIVLFHFSSSFSSERNLIITYELRIVVLQHSTWFKIELSFFTSLLCSLNYVITFKSFWRKYTKSFSQLSMKWENTKSFRSFTKKK